MFEHFNKTFFLTIFKKNIKLSSLVLLFLYSTVFSNTNVEMDEVRHEIILVENEKSNAYIFLNNRSDVVMNFASDELQSYIFKISGVRIPILDHRSQGVCIRFETDPSNDLPFDAYKIKTEPDSIVLSSNYSRGILYAVYDLLEQLGCSWVYPGTNEEIIPKLKRITFDESTKIKNPQIEHRGLALYGLDSNSINLGKDIIDWMAKNRFNLILTSEDRPSDSGISPAHGTRWSQVANKLLDEVQKRGIILDMSEHSTHLFFPKSLFNEHPDWFAMNSKGIRIPGQICYSNQHAIEYYSNRQIEYIKKHPEISILGTWPMDGGGYCECNECKKPDTVFKMTALVAAKTAKIRPDLTVEYLAYKPQTFPVPTTVDIPENISVLLCGRTDQLAVDWVKSLKNARGVYYFDYRSGDNWYWASNIWLRPQYERDTVNISAKIGFRGIIPLFLPIQNWWRSCFNFYFMSRAYWDPQLDIDKELKTYCSQYYGKNAQAVDEIFNSIFTKMQNPELLKCHRAWNEKDDPVINANGLKELKKTSNNIFAELIKLQKNETDPAMFNRLNRISEYITFFNLYYAARNSKLDADKAALLSFADKIKKSDGVCMDPAYLKFIYEKRKLIFTNSSDDKKTKELFAN